MAGWRREEEGLFPSMAKPESLLPARRQGINYNHMAGLQDGFMKAAPFNMKPGSPPEVSRTHKGPYFPCASCTPPPSPPDPSLPPPPPPLQSKPEFQLQPRHELQPKNNFRPPLSSNHVWGRHPRGPFPNTHLDRWRLYPGRKNIYQEVGLGMCGTVSKTNSSPGTPIFQNRKKCMSFKSTCLHTS